MEMEERTLQITTTQTQAPVYLQATGLFILRYGLAAMMLLFGLQKWTKAEAKGLFDLMVGAARLNTLESYATGATSRVVNLRSRIASDGLTRLSVTIMSHSSREHSR